MPRYYRALLTAALLGAFSLPALAQTAAPAAPAAPMADTTAPDKAAPQLAKAKTTKMHAHHHAAKKAHAKTTASPATDGAAPKN